MLSAALRRRVLAPTHNALRQGFSAHVVRYYASFPDHQVVKMPALSPTMQAGNIGAWQKKPGDTIAPGEVLVEIETDKAQMDFEFQEEGVIAKLLKEPGEKDVPVGTVGFSFFFSLFCTSCGSDEVTRPDWLTSNFSLHSPLLS